MTQDLYIVSESTMNGKDGFIVKGARNKKMKSVASFENSLLSSGEFNGKL